MSKPSLLAMAWTAVARFFLAAARSSAAKTDLGLGTPGSATPVSRGKFCAASRQTIIEKPHLLIYPSVRLDGITGISHNERFARFFLSTLRAKHERRFRRATRVERRDGLRV